MITSLIQKLQRCKDSIPAGMDCLTESLHVFCCLILNKIASLAFIAASCLDARLTIVYPADALPPYGIGRRSINRSTVGGIALGIGDHLLAATPKCNTPVSPTIFA